MSTELTFIEELFEEAKNAYRNGRYFASCFLAYGATELLLITTYRKIFGETPKAKGLVNVLLKMQDKIPISDEILAFVEAMEMRWKDVIEKFQEISEKLAMRFISYAETTHHRLLKILESMT